MSKPIYERPSLVRHQMGMMNKFGRLQGTKPLTHIDGVAVADLVAQHTAQTGVAVNVVSVGGVDAAKRVQAGEAGGRAQ